ncbi:MAG: tetratricopeptide repeat protein, partial [Desulfuromonadales bacterium]|nr:tetratricopeptide repeat protein [Desulfuromonadales bacterium]
DWTPVYLDEKTYILIRDTEKNSTVIKRHRIDKRLFVNKVADHLRSFAQSSPTDVKFQIGLTEMLIYIGRYAEAEKHLAIIEKLAPGHPEMASLQNQLEVLRGGKKR